LVGADARRQDRIQILLLAASGKAGDEGPVSREASIQRLGKSWRKCRVTVQSGFARTTVAVVTISTDRLDLIQMDAGMLIASLEGRRGDVERRLAAQLPEVWPFHGDVFRMRLDQIREDPSVVPWLLRAMVLRDERRVIGQIGFHTGPGPDYLEPFSPGAVELGYTVHPDYRRRGFAREAARGLMCWAETRHGIRNFVLSIRPDNVVSQAMARQMGFVKIGEHLDEVDGPEDVLEWRVDSRL
jgi:[ribosomal protein S5]-alanine N-acetyltransferase